jgi:Uma2 family endonuclease|tara:strand:+ start:26808 stop:27416 length:609 start_codon:yes stop_codon:yes gene_type:complete
MSVAEKRFVTDEEYLAWEREADFKSEYLRGEIYAMSGAGLNHNIIASNLNRAIGNRLEGRPRLVLGSDMRVQVDVADAYFYPDISGLCGEFEFHDDRQDTYKNPQFIIEILSDSTESYDKGKKFFNYQMLSSLKEYVLVSQKMVAVELYRKDGDRWIYQLLRGDDECLELESVGCEVPIEEVYRNVKFPVDDEAPVKSDVPR